MRSKRSLFGTASLSLASLLAISSSSGCSKIEELTGSEKKEAKPEDPKPEAGQEGKEAKPEAAETPAVGEKVAVADGGEVEVAPVEPIPVEELHTGLDLMLKLVPAGAEFMIARDATVVADYVEEATRFLDGPMAKLKTGPLAGDSDLQEVEDAFDELKTKTTMVKVALDASGIQLTEGAAIFNDNKSGESFIVFNAPDPNALVAVGKATGQSDLSDLKCKAIESHPGFNICGDDQAAVDAYKPSEDPAPLRAAMGENLPGVELDEANLVAHMGEGKDDEFYLAVTTIPGLVHMAVQAPNNADVMKFEEGMKAGPAQTLARVKPGSGFVWAHMTETLRDELLSEFGMIPPEAGKSLTGEVILAGSVDPGGIIVQARTSDTAAWEALLDEKFSEFRAEVPKEIPDVKGSKVVFEQLELEEGATKAKALHLGVTGLPEADVLKSFTGVHLDGWAFVANDTLTLAMGPDQEHVGKLLDTAGGGPSAETLASLPPPLVEGLGRNEVSAIAHMPMDFLHGAQMHTLVRAALKEIPEAQPEQILAVTGLLAPFSSSTTWVAMPGGKPVIHVAVQSIGNRATDEGRAALDAAHTVADGGDPVAAFASLAAAYGASPMAWAYKTRAGVEGPGYMVGSGLGAVLATAAVAVPVAMGKSNKSLADDLGVKPEDPEPELKPTTKPKQPKTVKKPKTDPKTDDPKTDDPKTDDPKTDDPKTDDPKTDDPKTDDPKTDDPKTDDPKPDRPLPPKPTPDEPKEPKRKRRFGGGRAK
ncbi:MAG: hypothetical protein AAGF11_17245 [Myxococcota bacterium]